MTSSFTGEETAPGRSSRGFEPEGWGSAPGCLGQGGWNLGSGHRGPALSPRTGGGTFWASVLLAATRGRADPAGERPGKGPVGVSVVVRRRLQAPSSGDGVESGLALGRAGGRCV